jgi:hypothetical protein
MNSTASSMNMHVREWTIDDLQKLWGIMQRHYQPTRRQLVAAVIWVNMLHPAAQATALQCQLHRLVLMEDNALPHTNTRVRECAAKITVLAAEMSYNISDPDWSWS